MANEPRSATNRIEISGNCAADPRFQYTASGRAVADVVIYSTRRWTGKDGNVAEETTRVKLVAWGDLAEDMHKGVFKGYLISGIGRLMPPEVWIDANGEAKAQNVVSIYEGEVLFKKNGETAPAPQESAGVPNDEKAPPDEWDGGDIPF